MFTSFKLKEKEIAVETDFSVDGPRSEAISVAVVVATSDPIKFVQKNSPAIKMRP